MPPSSPPWFPTAAAQAFADGDDARARELLARARDAQPSDSLDWARLERLYGLLSIHMLREVEGTFALERADPILERYAAPKPDLSDLGDWAD